MDRNFRTFLIMSMAMLMIFIGLQRMFLPNVPPDVAQKAGGENQAKAVEDTAGPVTDQPKADEPKADQAAKVEAPAKDGDATLPSDSQKSDKPPGEKPPGDQPTEAAAAARAPNLEKVVTLGSMDPTKGYRLLVTATSRGGAIERIELVDEKKVDRFRFRAIEHRGGYLGYLGWRPTTGGVLITTVPVDSPAALAKSPDTTGGLLPDDVLNSIDGVAVSSYDGVQRVLKEIKAGKSVKLEVTRNINGVASNLSFSTTLSQPPLDVLRTQEYLSEQVPGNLQRLSCLTTLAT
ncbi:MAG: PDZ domain-containing protein, partial [Pirellulaceae bacterium]|nr:PDZ domain-containing protein [Pirellulaceae bacterium]